MDEKTTTGVAPPYEVNAPTMAHTGTTEHTATQPDGIVAHQQTNTAVTDVNAAEKGEFYNPNVAQPGTPGQAPLGQVTPGTAPDQEQFNTLYPLGSLTELPMPVECPSCHYRGKTRVEQHTGGCMHLVACLVCWMTCCGCFVYLFKGLKDCEHFCPQCGIRLATWKRSGRTQVEAFS